MHRQTCRILMYFCFQADIPPDSDTRLGLSVRRVGWVTGNRHQVGQEVSLFRTMHRIVTLT